MDPIVANGAAAGGADPAPPADAPDALPATASAAPIVSAAQALHGLWLAAGLPAPALAGIDLPPGGPVLPSSFAVAAAAQASLGAAALAAACIGRHRGGPAQHVRVEAEHAALDSLGWFTRDGVAPKVWDKLSGLYRCGEGAQPGWVRLHANFAHHRDGALRLLGLPPGPDTGRTQVQEALHRWAAQDFETAASEAGLVATAARGFDEWDAHPQARALAARPVLQLQRLGDVPPRTLPRWRSGDQPLSGLRVLDLTRILAGPVAGRTLAAYGADVMLVNAPHLPNIESIADTSRGKLSAHVDLKTAAGRDTLRGLLRSAQVFVQGYRPGGLAALGFAPQDLAAAVPGIVAVSLSAYGPEGPWSARRGFDSLVQTATGFNLAEAQAFGDAEPRALPLQILDYAAGYLLAFGAQAALLRQAQEGGSWHVQVSLAGVGRWLRSLGRVAGGTQAQRPPLEPYLEEVDSGFGRLRVLRHAAQFSATPARWSRPAMPPGTHPPAWPAP
jgi:crotonobetainyl-CoA:carnitine CoA-transferase CaiB-like acyl-CoA transferase